MHSAEREEEREEGSVRKRLSSERWAVFIAGVRLSAMVMKVASQNLSSAALSPVRSCPLFVYRLARVFVLVCVFMCLGNRVACSRSHTFTSLP